MWKEMAFWGRKLEQSGLVSSRFGNVSERTNNGLLIKRTGVMLGEIMGPEDVVEVGPGLADPFDGASTETQSHRTIYLATDAQAIIHAHPPFAIVESLLQGNEIVPLDSEGLPFLGTIPIVDGGTGEQALWDHIAHLFKSGKYKGFINRGHGTFAFGPDLKDCFNTTAMIEHSCRIRYYRDLAAMESYK
ncbi:MAG TPA: aldolase [Methanocella sp.]|nr:aldolase [Methanocella sp.]